MEASSLWMVDLQQFLPSEMIQVDEMLLALSPKYSTESRPLRLTIIRLQMAKLSP
jgi:hypothetical protein